MSSVYTGLTPITYKDAILCVQCVHGPNPDNIQRRYVYVSSVYTGLIPITYKDAMFYVSSVYTGLIPITYKDAILF